MRLKNHRSFENVNAFYVNAFKMHLFSKCVLNAL